MTRSNNALPLSYDDRRDRLLISVRAFVPMLDPPKLAKKTFKKLRRVSPYTLIFDCETKTDSGQSLRFGAYQLRKGDDLIEVGIFGDKQGLTTKEQATLRAYAKTHRGVKLLTLDRFVNDVFYNRGYALRANIVGFNLPFDISRLAFHHASARSKTMQGGFTFQLSTNRWKPRVQVRHLSSRAAFKQFTKPSGKFATSGMKKRGLPTGASRGSFIDVRTVAAALTTRSFTLGELAVFLETPHRKQSVESYDAPVTKTYIDYGLNDVQVTWECFVALRDKFNGFELNQTRLGEIVSEAGLGKGYLKEMGIVPWRGMQPDFPNALSGTILSSYYGGRSEVHLRRMLTQVLYCDFRSMYPTVCTLMGLWSFVSGKGVTWRESTVETSALLGRITIECLNKEQIWRQLRTVVQIAPDDDILPVRANYGGEPQAKIGLNYLSSEIPVWYTLADCIASKLLTGKCPKIVRAISFAPKEAQDELRPINITGNRNFRINSYKDDFYRRVIDLRNQTKARLKTAKGSTAITLKSEEQFLKTLANSTSYGIFLELNIAELDHKSRRECYGPSGEPFQTSTRKIEEPGRYFHPILATLSTGGARLMLAMAETRAAEAGLDWTFCDTDSMALAKPEAMDDQTFYDAARSICDRFIPLNPYELKEPLFKTEDANYAIRAGKLTNELAPLYCLPISDKRYALFNIDRDGLPIIRKASAHGLGHLLPPYDQDDAPKTIPKPAIGLEDIGVERWQYDLWYQIVRATLEGYPDRVDLDYHPALGNPAAGRYGATTPPLLKWFKKRNKTLDYNDRVRPFNFMLVYQAKSAAQILDAGLSTADGMQGKRPVAPKPIAPYDTDTKRAAANCFDRETGDPVPIEQLKTYREALADYHLHPETKFLNGEYLDRGQTRRRHVEVIAINHIGKEANRWEEQYYLGLNIDAQINYGVAPNDTARFMEALRDAAGKFGQRELASAMGITRKSLCDLWRRKSLLISKTLERKFLQANAALTAEHHDFELRKAGLLKEAAEEIDEIGLKELAARIGTDSSNLSKTLKGQRNANIELLDRLGRYFASRPKASGEIG